MSNDQGPCTPRPFQQLGALMERNEDRVVTAVELCIRRGLEKLSLPSNVTLTNIDNLRVDFSILFTTGHYLGDTLEFKLIFPESFPFDPPKLYSLHLLFHPNVLYDDGKVCMNLLRLDWLPTISIESIIMCTLCMFSEEDYMDVEAPLSKEAAALYMENREQYITRTRNNARYRLGS
jgi:ubiquitin-conjugating enzyme E2 M